jgi:hypothetical protein
MLIFSSLIEFVFLHKAKENQKRDAMFFRSINILFIINIVLRVT